MRALDLFCGVGGVSVGLQRHRLFEMSFPTLSPCCNHGVWAWGKPVSKSNQRRGRTRSRVIAVYGGGNAPEADKREAMGIGWMNRYELSQAIPPAFAEWIGRQALAVMP